MKRKVIDSKNLPMRPPLIGVLVAWLVIDKLDAPGWVWGAVGLFFAFLWIAWLFDVSTREDTDILK